MIGKALALSPQRQFICDLLAAAQKMPTIPVQRHMNLGPVAEARRASALRPSWLAVFTLAYARVAAVMPELRRAYVKLPRPQLYEYPISVAGLALERVYRGERSVFIGRIKDPASQSLAEINRLVRTFQEAEVEQIKDFQRSLRLSRVPGFLRSLVWWLGLNIGRQRGNYLGTFGVTAYSALGAESLHPLAPVTTTLTYGVIGDDGAVDVRLVYDHRVLDGATVARALQMLEDELNGGVCRDLLAGEPESPPCAVPEPICEVV